MALRPNPWHPRVPRLADGAAYARCFDHWGEAAYGEVVRVYQLGYLQPARRRRWGLAAGATDADAAARRGAGQSRSTSPIPCAGSQGLGQEPPPERVLTLWADDLLSVSHGDDWTFVVEAQQPFDRSWLDLLAPPRGTTYGYWHAVVAASFAGPRPAGRFRVADVDATTHLTRVHIADRRDSSAQRAFGRRRQDVRGSLD